jgi:FkbM family methyltransferase
MDIRHLAEANLNKFQAATDKLRWGVRVVGVGATLEGSARYMTMRLSHPERSEIRLRSGPILEFDYPSQFPSALVMFGDVIDPEFAFLRDIARPGWTIVDVGAAIGQFTLFAARLPDAVVHAFEPSGANVRTLRRNVVRNGAAGHVTVHQVALSNTEGQARFETAERTWMSGLAGRGADTGEMVEVKTLTGALGRLHLDHVAVIKINVAGFEPAVFEGAQDYLAAGRADVLIALLGLQSLPWYAATAALGYRFFYYHPAERTLFEVTAFDAGSVLDHRPWPARHIIGIRTGALDAGLAASIAIRKLRRA